MRADDVRRSLAHRLDVQRLQDLIAVAPAKNIRFRQIADQITVFFAAGAEPCMEIRRHFAQRGDAHVPDALERLPAACQDVIGCEHDPIRRNPEFPAERRTLPQGVHTGIRTAGSVKFNFFPADVTQYLLQMSLYGSDVWLSLPSAKIGAIIFDCHKNITFHYFCCPCPTFSSPAHLPAYDSCRSLSLPLPIAAIRSACFPSILCKV